MPAGRPRSFQSVQELDERAEAYFEACKATFADDGKPLTYGEPVTAYGLSIACGCTWETMREYRKGVYDTENEKYSVATKWWIEQIKHYAEKGLYTARSAAGPIFHLANLTRTDSEPWKSVEGRELTGANGGAVSFTLLKADESL